MIDLQVQVGESLELIKNVEFLETRNYGEVLGKLIEVVETPEPLPQKFEGGLNQGLDYVEPPAPVKEEDLQEKRIGCKRDAIQKLIGELKEVQQEQQTMTVERR